MKKTITRLHLRKLYCISRRLRSMTDAVQDRPFGAHCAWRLAKARQEVDELINTFDRRSKNG